MTSSSATRAVGQPKAEVPYILGHSEPEVRRLMYQAALLKPITERLLRTAGLRPGMSVLDVGCGMGDVTMLAAELVGPEGKVLGIDRSADVLTLAKERASEAGFGNVEFRQAAAEDFDGPERFDFAVGRYVLVHQADPAAFIRAVASQVRPSGVISLHEIGVYGECQAIPRVVLWEQAWTWIREALHSVMAHPDSGGGMIGHFQGAGLRDATMFCEVPTGGGPDSPLYAWMTQTVESLLPQIEKIGVATAAEIGIDTLEERLRREVTAVQGQVTCPMQFCGWARL